MSTFRRKPEPPVTVEARRLTEENADEVAEWADTIVYRGDRHGHTDPPWAEHTCVTLDEIGVHAWPEANAVAVPGDYVIRNPNGTFTAVGASDFEARFEPACETTN